MHGFRESGFDIYWSLYLSAQKRKPCVYISTLLRYQQKVVRLALDPWFKSSYEPLRKLALIHVRTTKAQICLRVRADWSAPLFFAVARFVFFFFEGEASHKFKWKAKWFPGMYKFLIESVITGLFSPLILLFGSRLLSCWQISYFLKKNWQIDDEKYTAKPPHNFNRKSGNRLI